MKNKAIGGLFSNNQIWEKPEAVTSQLRTPEARKLWLDLSDFVQRIRLAEAGQAVSATEAAAIYNKIGLHAFTDETTLKNAIANAKSQFFRTIQRHESPFYDGNGKPNKVLQDIWKAPGAISSQDPFFKKYRTKTDAFGAPTNNDERESKVDNYLKSKGK